MCNSRESLPAGFAHEIERMLGEEAPAFFDSLNEPAALALRLNPARPGAMEAAREFMDAPVPWERLGWYLRPGARPGAGIAHAGGAFYLQEASAMVSVAALRPVPGERILDLCAAPGGKSTQIAAALMGAPENPEDFYVRGADCRDGLLISNEPERSRARVLASNLERMGVRNAAVVCAYPDALAARWPEYFDAVLCDAPCSGEGMFRRDPDSREQWNSASPAGCAKRQAEILDRAAEMVRPGGRLVYSTCTFNAQENEGTIAAFLDRHPDFTPEDFALNGIGSSHGGMIRVWPHRVRGDGHFAAKLRRTGSAALPDAPAHRNGREELELLRKLEAEVCALPETLRRRAARIGDYLYAVPEECPDMTGLHVVSPGVRLLRAGRNYIEPEHALAMALDRDMAARRMELDDAQARRYLAGEALPCDREKGWTLIQWRGLPLGWGKASGGQMKNHLPKGLRLSLHEIAYEDQKI